MSLIALSVKHILAYSKTVFPWAIATLHVCCCLAPKFFAAALGSSGLDEAANMFNKASCDASLTTMAVWLIAGRRKTTQNKNKSDMATDD